MDKKLVTGLTVLFILVAGFLGYSKFYGVGSPEILVSVDGEEYRGIQGSYCWEKNRFNARCVDTVSPVEMVETEQPDGITVGSDERIRLVTEGYESPEQYRITFRDYSGNQVLSATTEDRIGFGNTGRYVLEVSAEWERGDVSYVFPVEIVPE